MAVLLWLRLGSDNSLRRHSAWWAPFRPSWPSFRLSPAAAGLWACGAGRAVAPAPREFLLLGNLEFFSPLGLPDSRVRGRRGQGRPHPLPSCAIGFTVDRPAPRNRRLQILGSLSLSCPVRAPYFQPPLFFLPRITTTTAGAFVHALRSALAQRNASPCLATVPLVVCVDALSLVLWPRPVFSCVCPSCV